MPTKLDRLQSTVRHAEQLWREERQSQERNAVNEGAWSVQVIEPILISLDWPRLRRRDLRGTGAYFEWPAKHKVDVALLDHGAPRAFLELKDKHHGRQSCRNDLGNKLAEHVELRSARVAVAAWFQGEAGLCPYRIAPDGSLTPGRVISLREASKDASLLVQLAAPVLLHDQPDRLWMSSTESDAGPVIPRCHPRMIQRRFFQLLKARMGITASLEPRHRCKGVHPPTPTYAYVELPGVLPLGSGLVFDFDNTMNRLQCFFYRDGNQKIGGSGTWDFDETGIDDAVLESFLEQRVLPEIERRRRCG